MKSVIVPLVPLVKCKTGDLSDVCNYRAIAISTSISKLFENVLSVHVKSCDQLDAYQFGFTSGCSTIFSLLSATTETSATNLLRQVGAVGLQPSLSARHVQMECHRRPCRTEELRGTRRWLVRHGNCAVWSTRADCTLAYLYTSHCCLVTLLNNTVHHDSYVQTAKLQLLFHLCLTSSKSHTSSISRF